MKHVTALPLTQDMNALIKWLNNSHLWKPLHIKHMLVELISPTEQHEGVKLVHCPVASSYDLNNGVKTLTQQALAAGYRVVITYHDPALNEVRMIGEFSNPATRNYS